VPPPVSPLPIPNGPLDPQCIKVVTTQRGRIGIDLSREIDIIFPAPVYPNFDLTQLLLSIQADSTTYRRFSRQTGRFSLFAVDLLECGNVPSVPGFLTHAHIMLPQTKNEDGRIVYLNQSALAALRSVVRSAETKATDTVFAGVTPEQVSVAFARLCRNQKILDFRFHDLRHTAANWLRMQGADIHTVAQLLGHKDLRMAARYQHLSPAFLAEAVGRLDIAYGPLALSPGGASAATD
jgi:hypothetical protein